jgi:hypothetical protein
MNATRYELVIGRRDGGKLGNTLATGHSFLNEGDAFYTLKLMMFPGQTYYMVKNRNSSDRYTIFAKIIREENSVRFQNPVGSGRLTDDLASHMELYFPVLRSQMFMCLYPANS